jgi:hypothetical protein
MQLSVWNLAGPHGPVVERTPRWVRAGRFAVEWAANVVEPGGGRG